MHSNGCFPLTFYFSLTFIKTSGSLEPAACARVQHEMVHSEEFESRRCGMSVWGQGCSHQTASLPPLCAWISETRAPRRLFTARCFFQIVSSQFPSHFLLMGLHHYLIILLTDTCWEVSKTKKNTHTHKKRTIFSHSALFWMEGDLLILVTTQLQSGHPLLTAASAHMSLIIVWI